MKLFLFPEAASLNNGYGIAVEQGYSILSPGQDDMIVWYTVNEMKNMLHRKQKDVVIRKNAFLSFRSIINILSKRDRTEVHSVDLNFLKGKGFDSIHCDDTLFYRAIKEIFPHTPLTIRFHNCFGRIYDRYRQLDFKLDWQYRTKLQNMYRLEREIFHDKLSRKIFISEEDRNYYCSTYGIWSDSEVWPFAPDMNKANGNRKQLQLGKKIVWFGGIESHKQSSIKWFVNDVFPLIRSKIPNIEFHLWGRNTDKYNNPSKQIYGHGYYDGEGMPIDNSLYINPDIIGGGVKIKLMSIIEAGMPLISTPFGFEGYSKEIVDNKYIHVIEQESWGSYIVDLLKNVS